MSKPGHYVRMMREHRGWDQAELAERSGISRATISSHENGHTTPSLKQRRRYAAAFGFDHVDAFDAGWRSQTVPQQLAPPGAPRGIPMLAQVPAGPGDIDPAEMGLDNGVASYRIPPQLAGSDDPTAFGLTVHGDSMSPTYQPGDLVICSPRAPHEDGMVAALRMEDGQCTLKRVFALDADRIELRPDNTRIPPKIVQREQILRMARVVTHIQRLWTGPASTPASEPTRHIDENAPPDAEVPEVDSIDGATDDADAQSADEAELARIEAWIKKQRQRKTR